MQNLTTTKQVFSWMMDRFETEGDPRSVPEEIAGISKWIRRSMKKQGFVNDSSIGGSEALFAAFFDEGSRVEMPGELAILAVVLSAKASVGGAERIGYADLMFLMSKTHNGLQDIVFREGEKMRAVLSRTDTRHFDVYFDVVIKS